MRLRPRALRRRRHGPDGRPALPRAPLRALLALDVAGPRRPAQGLPDAPALSWQPGGVRRQRRHRRDPARLQGRHGPVVVAPRGLTIGGAGRGTLAAAGEASMAITIPHFAPLGSMALSFDGRGGYVHVQDHPSLRLAEFTIEA